eukprot:6200307-Pleurochrysis_carterae.AAC.1
MAMASAAQYNEKASTHPASRAPQSNRHVKAAERRASPSDSSRIWGDTVPNRPSASVEGPRSHLSPVPQTRLQRRLQCSPQRTGIRRSKCQAFPCCPEQCASSSLALNDARPSHRALEHPLTAQRANARQRAQAPLSRPPPSLSLACGMSHLDALQP